MLIYLQMASMVFTLELFFLQSSTPIQRVWYSCFIALWHIKKFCISCNCMKCTNIIIFHSFEIFFKLLGSFLSKNLKKRFSFNGTEKKNKLECLFIFSGGNCTLNLKISQIIFFTFSQKWCGFYKCSNGSDKHQCTQRAKVPFFVQKVNKTLRKNWIFGVKSGLLTSQWSKRKFLSKKFKHKTSKYNFWTKNELLE